MGNIVSILDSIKKLHGVGIDDVSFDTDIIIHINSALMILNQLGVGPSEGFYIDDATKNWSDYVPNQFIAESIKSFVYIKVRLIFDPPSSSVIVDALKSAADEYACRIRDWAEENKV